MQLLAAGVYDLGLTAAEFSSFTPRHIDAFYKRHLAAESRRMMLTLWYANTHRDTNQKPEPFSIDDFVPGATAGLGRVAYEPDHPETPEETIARLMGPRMTPEQQVTSIQAQARGFGTWSTKDA